MNYTKEQHKEFLKELVAEECQKGLFPKPDFSWEMLWKYEIFLKNNLFISSMISDALASKESPENLFEIHGFAVLSDDDKNFIEKLKKDFYKKHKIKEVSYKEMLPLISEFFTKNRNVDFMSLTEDEQHEKLKDEDIHAYGKELFDYLGLTHIQFKYLYQKKSVYKQVI